MEPQNKSIILPQDNPRDACNFKATHRFYDIPCRNYTTPNTEFDTTTGFLINTLTNYIILISHPVSESIMNLKR